MSRVCMCDDPKDVHTEGYYSNVPKSNVTMKLHFNKDNTCICEEETGQASSPQRNSSTESNWADGNTVIGESLRREGTWHIDPASKHVKIKLGVMVSKDRAPTQTTVVQGEAGE